MRKILFLDIDGVLNSYDNMHLLSHMWKNDKTISRDKYGILFDRRCVGWLKYIVSMTQCEIVMSSAWRSSGLKNMRDMWLDRDLPGRLVDVTPECASEETINLHAETANPAERGYEIQEWLDEHKPDKYCIVDDDSDMLPSQKKFFVKTQKEYGLTREKAIEIIRNLNNEFE